MNAAKGNDEKNSVVAGGGMGGSTLCIAAGVSAYEDDGSERQFIAECSSVLEP